MDRVLKVLLSAGGNYLAVTGLVNSKSENYNLCAKHYVNVHTHVCCLIATNAAGNDSPVLISVYSLPVDAWLQQVGGDQVRIIIYFSSCLQKLAPKLSPIFITFSDTY